jgi:hypothetical protein
LAYLATGNDMLLLCTIFFGLLTLPASAIYSCDSGWPRQTMAAITLGLVAAFGFALAAALLADYWQSGLLQQVALQVFSLLPLACLASQFAAMYLTQVTPKK